jgi:acetylornithine/N-succinyldiaminopimelate aminotransferase
MSTLRNQFYNHLAQTSDMPMELEIVSADGNYQYDSKGKKYLDLISGIAVSNLGHNHPAIKKAISTQLDAHLHLMVYGEFIQSPQVKLANALAELLPKNLSSVFFTNSGSEAVEGALKLAKRFTGRTELISCKNAYHGSTHGALSIIGSEEWKNSFRPLLPDVRQILFNHWEDLSLITDKTACVIIEPVQGEAGVRIGNVYYLEALRKKCDETGTLLIFDEIQSGFGRTGKFFAFEHFNVIPDILLLGKALGGGMPLGAFISSKEIMESLQSNPVLGHITTFGGHPLSCAASLAALEVLKNEKWISEVEEKELLFKELLNHPEIIEVRGIGLMFAVELRDFEYIQKVIKKCIEGGLITDWFLFSDNSLRIAPPLTITKKEIESACEIILQSLS